MLGAPGHGSGPERNGGVFALIVEHLAGGWAGVVVDRRVDMGVTDRRPLPGRVVGTRVPVVAPPAPSGMPQSVHLDVDELARVAALAAADAAAAGAVEPAQAVDTPTAPGPDGTVEAGMPRRRPDGSRDHRGLPPWCGDPCFELGAPAVRAVARTTGSVFTRRRLRSRTAGTTCAPWGDTPASGLPLRRPASTRATTVSQPRGVCRALRCK
jgi:hypothetical protein